jgi:hypothetical protein
MGHVSSHWLKNKVLKSLCKDRKDENRAILRSISRGLNLNKDKIEQLSKYRKNQRKKKLDKDQQNTIQTSGVRNDAFF